jgi:alpha-galactosidase
VGPGGIIRAQRNIPVFLGLARDMEELCPDAWMLNLTNPMTTICRAVTRESSVRTVGLCHEVTITQFLLSLLLDASFLDLQPVVAGVNHLPIISSLDVAGRDGLELLRELLADADRRAGEPLAMELPDDLLPGAPSGPDGRWTKGDLLRHQRVKLELFSRFGVLPAAGDRHLVEFFPGFLTEQSGWGERWGVALTTIEEREASQRGHIADLDELLGATEVPVMPSGEMVAPVIQCLELDQAGWFPLNVPNEGQVADLPDGATVESICVVDGKGVRGRDEVHLPGTVAELLHRVGAAQEATVDAAVRGDPDRVFDAMLLDPLAGRLDYDRLAEMTREMLAATRQWLPQFAPLGTAAA